MWQSHFFVFKRLQKKLHDFLYATLSYATPGGDLIQSILFINKKQCFSPFLQENNRGGGGVGALECSKNNAFSKNNVIVSFYKQKLPFSPFV